MDGRIGRVLELLGQEVTLRIGSGHGLGPLMAPFMPSAPGVRTRCGAEGGQDPAALDAHGLGHGQGELVPPGRGHVGQGDARIAAGGLDDLHARLEQPALLGVPDHGGADAALDGIGGVSTLDLGQDGRLGPLR